MRKVIALVLAGAFAQISPVQAAHQDDFFPDLNRTAPRSLVVSPGVVARQPFDRINDSAPVRKPTSSDDVFTGE